MYGLGNRDCLLGIYYCLICGGYGWRWAWKWIWIWKWFWLWLLAGKSRGGGAFGASGVWVRDPRCVDGELVMGKEIKVYNVGVRSLMN